MCAGHLFNSANRLAGENQAGIILAGHAAIAQRTLKDVISVLYFFSH
jgi:hypothetical protein